MREIRDAECRYVSGGVDMSGVRPTPMPTARPSPLGDILAKIGNWLNGRASGTSRPPVRPIGKI
ncbi:TPA: hypothetical protein SAY52_002251 [Burkholderia cenocepacia]|nr:hypothetical protein [Burkholderia cenocepacia]